MKKVTLLFTVLCLIIFTSACGSLFKYDKITTEDFFSGMKCEIPLDSLYSFAPYDHYHTNDSFESIKRKLEEKQNEMNSFTVETLNDNSLLIQLFEDEKNALFVLKEYHTMYQETELSHHYWFSDFSTHLYTLDATEKAYDIAIMDGIPLPHHLLGEEIYGNFSENNEIPIIGNIDEFEAFYEIFQRVYPDHPLEIERLENQLILRNIPVRFNYFVDADGIRSYDSKQIDQITITFSEGSDHKPILTLSCGTG